MSLASLRCRILRHRYGPWRLERQPSSWTLLSACERCLDVQMWSFPLFAFGSSPAGQPWSVASWPALLRGIAEEDHDAPAATPVGSTPPPVLYSVLGRGEGDWFESPIRAALLRSDSLTVIADNTPTSSTSMQTPSDDSRRFGAEGSR